MYPALFAFGFESSWMFGWLLAGAAPLLIHLLNRRKYRETAWAAMAFLLAAAKRRTRRIRIEQWLLLLLRTLVIVMLVTAVAGPRFEHVAPIFSPNGSTHRVLVIDSSYSMAFQANGRTRFDEAKLWAARIVEQSPKGDGFTLVQMANPPRAIVATPGMEKALVRQEIQSLELLHTGADLLATLGEVRKVIETARRDSPRLTRHEVYFFTDLQRGTWLPAMSDAASTAVTYREEVRNRAVELASIAQLEVFNLGQAGDANLAVTSLDLRDPQAGTPLVLAGRNVTLDASVRDFGHLAPQHRAVDLLIDGVPAGGKDDLAIPPGGTAVASFEHRFVSGGDHAVEVRLSGDPTEARSASKVDIQAPGRADALEVDKHRYLVVQVRQAIRVLCIDGRPAGDPRRASVFNLALALSSRSDPNRRSAIELDVAPESAVLERDLGRYDCVMLSNVPQFTASEARVLDNYLVHGGGLVFFLGDRVIADNYNQVLAGPHSYQESGLPVLPARLVAVAKNPGGRLDPLDYRHPIVQKFRNQEKAKLLQSPIEQYFKVRLPQSLDAPRSPLPADSPAAGSGPERPPAAKGEGHNGQAVLRSPPEVVLALSNGDPLIVARPTGRGRVVLVTTSADASWNKLPLWGTYEPLVKEMLAWCIAGQAQPRNVEVGDPLGSALPATPALSNVSIEPPADHDPSGPALIPGSAQSGRRYMAPDMVPAPRTAPLDVHGDYSVWRYDDTLISGVYTARFAAPLSQSQLFAVNLKTAESDLASISRDELERDAWPHVPLGYQTSWRAEDAPLPSPAPAAWPLHVGLLSAVVVLLILESLLAWLFGHNTR